MVLPAPGGPCRNMWCRPAAATSSAHFASSCPITSARSRTASRSSAEAVTVSSTGSTSGTGSPRSSATSWLSEANPSTSIPSTRLASVAWRSGTTTRVNPARTAARVAGSTPGTGRSRPSSPSSPSRAVRDSASSGMTPDAASTAAAMARS